jgi:hypothetical protein
MWNEAALHQHCQSTLAPEPTKTCTSGFWQRNGVDCKAGYIEHIVQRLSATIRLNKLHSAFASYWYFDSGASKMATLTCRSESLKVGTIINHVMSGTCICKPLISLISVGKSNSNEGLRLVGTVATSPTTTA